MKTFLFLMLMIFSVPLNATELIIKTETETFVYQTDIAQTPQELQQGLMFKKELPDNYAMTFLFPSSRVVRMWMKNTFLPLDMIFFDADGVISHIHQNAEPFSEETISSFLPAAGVIELLAGTVKEKKIKVGDLIQLKR